MKKFCGLLAVLLAAVFLAGCGITPPMAATTMHLKRAEGQVGVSDDAGKDVEAREDLGLYSGYGVDTRSESYAWIALDKVKLTKMDQDSEIAIQKDGRDLEIEVISGSLFFNVTEPLEDDETMTIRASTMMVGIRGTCGWVSLSEDGKQLSVWLLEGKVRCKAKREKETIQAGEMAVMTEDGEITVTKFAVRNVPAFVLEELEEDLLEGLEAGSPANPGLDSPSEEPRPSEEPVSLAAEPPLVGSALVRPAPDFLNEEQQQLFLHASCAADVFLGGDPSGVNYFPLADGSEFQWDQAEYGTVELDGQIYALAQGRYRQWDDFKAMMDGLFTPEYQRELIGNRFRSTEDGRLCYMELLMLDSLYYLGAETDTYELVSQTEDEICFNQICHYIALGWDDTMEEGEPYSMSYPVRMVRTSQGWRVAEIYVLRDG